MTRATLLALWAHWRHHPMQAVTLLLGLALATALWSGVQAINAEARKSYANAANTLGQTEYDRLTGSEISMADYAALRRAGWLVSPVIEGRLASGAQIIGIDPLSSPPRPGLGSFADGTLDLTGFLASPGALLAAPETEDLLTALDIPIVLAADLPIGTALTDLRVAQRLLNRETLSYLIIAPDQPVGLPPLASVTHLTRITPDDGTDIAQLTESFHLNLTAFGLLSFAVGLFIVQSAIGLAFEQRRASFRTLRALGVPLGRLVGLLAVELMSFAITAGFIGLVIGYIIAATLLPGVAATLRGLYGAEISGTLQFDPAWAVSALVITLGGAALAGAQALWRVMKLPLLAPAQPRAWARASRRQMILQLAAAGFLVLVAGASAAFGDSLLAGFACLAALLLSAALALPACLIGLLDLITRWVRGPMAEWLLSDARQQVPALSLALMALLLALAANIGVGTMVGAFRGTFVGWLDQRLASELYVSARSEEEAAAMRGILNGRADAVLPIWSVDRTVAGQPAEVFGIVDHATYREKWPLVADSDGAWDALANGTGALINEQVARRSNLWPGSTVELGPDWAVEVVGVYSDYGNPRAQAIVGYDALAARHPDPVILRFAVRVDPDAAEALRDDLRERLDLAPQQIINQEEVKRFSLDVFNQTFVVTAALNILTFAVAGFAMLTSLLTLSQMRLPQVAPIWALGQTPARLAMLEMVRTALLAGLTWVIAVPLGLALAWVLLAIVNVQAFGWRIPMAYFPGEWLWLGLLALLAALAAAFWPMIRLLRLPPMQLLRSFASDR